MNLNGLNSTFDFDQPGPLRSKATLTLHSREALKLFSGRPADDENNNLHDFAINNLKKFGKRMNAIWIAAQHNDPFADWSLYQIEQKIEEAEQSMTNLNGKLRELLGRVNSHEILVAQSIKPIAINLNFANPYSYRAADLIAQYDSLACAVLTACHVGRMNKLTRDNAIKKPAKVIRKVFMLVSEWKFTGITRTSYNPESEVAAAAEERMGKLPQGVLEGKLRANISPDIRAEKEFNLPDGERQDEDIGAVMLQADSSVTPINKSLLD